MNEPDLDSGCNLEARRTADRHLWLWALILALVAAAMRLANG